MEEQSPFYSMYLSHQANALPPAPEKSLEERVPTPMDDVPKPEPEQKLNVLGEPVEPSELGQTIVEGITDFGRRIVDPFMTSPAVQGPIKGATDLVNQISSLDNELGQVLGVYDRDRQPMQLPDITEDMPVASEGGKELIATLTQFLAPFKAAGGFKAGPLTMESFRAGALADALFDPESGNLWDMAKEQGWVPELTQYLSAKVDEEAPAEDRLMSRLKTVFGEGGPLGVAADLTFKIAKAGKQVMGLGGEEVVKQTDTAADAVKESLPKFTATYSDPAEIASFANKSLRASDGVGALTVEGILHKYVKALAGEPVTKKDLCHSQACKAVFKKHEEGDKLVMLRSPKGESIAHSIVIDKSGKLKFDNMEGSWDAETRTWKGNIKGAPPQPMIAVEEYDVDLIKQAADIYKKGKTNGN